MARTAKKGSPTRAGKAKPAKSVPRKKAAPARRSKPARKATKAAKAPTRPKAARKPAKGARAAPRSEGSGRSRPVHDDAHDRHMQEIRQRVARRRPGMAPLVDPAQQDPSIIAPPGPPVPPVDTLRQNWGDAKDKGVTRNDKPTNWFRQAPKPPSK